MLKHVRIQIIFCQTGMIIIRKDLNGNLEKFKNNMPDNSNDDEDIYFVTEPSMEQESSDWADMFSSMINYDMQVIYDRCSKVRAKAKYLCEEIERAFETVDETAYWNRYFTETE